MALVCSIKPHVKNAKGEIKESDLFTKLDEFYSNREEAKRYYALSKDEEFQQLAASSLEYDSLGEPTFESFSKTLGLDGSEDFILKKLNREFGGKYDYDKAVQLSAQFNNNHSLNGTYLALMEGEKGGFKISIVKNNATNWARHLESIEAQRLFQHTLQLLENYGVKVDFLNEAPFNGIYTTEDAKRASDGFYHLIKVLKGKELSQQFYDEVGHFAIGILGEEHPLVKRLANTLKNSEELQREFLGENAVVGTTSSSINAETREAMGHMVGKYLMKNGLEENKQASSLIKKIFSFLKNIFKSLKLGTVSNARLEAQEAASAIATGFLNARYEGNIETALNTSETLFRKGKFTSTEYTEAFKDAVKTLDTISEELRTIKYSEDEKTTGADRHSVREVMRDILSDFEGGRSMHLSGSEAVANTLVIEGFLDMMQNLSDVLSEGSKLQSLIREVDVNDIASIKEALPARAKNLNEARIVIRNLMTLFSSDNFTKIFPARENSEMAEWDPRLIKLHELKNKVSKFLSAAQSQYVEARNVLNLVYLQDILGTDKLRAYAGVTFKHLKDKEIQKQGATLGQNVVLALSKMIGVEVKNEWKELSIEQQLEYLDDDIGIIRRLFTSAGNSPDLITQIIDKLNRQTKYYADQAMQDALSKAAKFEERLHKIGIKDYRILFETYEDSGEFTGNFISEYNYGEWERKHDKLKAEAIKAFKENTPNIEEMSRTAAILRFQSWWIPQRNAFHKENSMRDEVADEWMPNMDYRNQKYYDLINKYNGLQEWLRDFMEFKGEFDSMLGFHVYAHNRAPQFNASMCNLVKNRMAMGTKRIAAITKTVQEAIFKTSQDGEEATVYGSHYTSNLGDEGVFRDIMGYELDHIKRVPIYGVNKLKDMSRLSTDIFASMLSYAEMAINYHSLMDVTSGVELVTDRLMNRKVGGKEEGETRQGRIFDRYNSRVYMRYTDYVEKEFFGISKVTDPKKMRTLLTQKLASVTSYAASVYFLGGNVAGGMVNTFTGVNELLKEASVGQFVNLTNLRNAHKLYYGIGKEATDNDNSPHPIAGNLFSNALNFGNLYKRDKVSMWIRKFNILDRNKQLYKDYGRHGRAWYGTKSLIFLPYSSGDHYMQTVSFLALADRIKVYDADGNEMKLYDAYEEDVNNKEGSGRILKLKNNGKIFQTKDGQEKLDFVNNIIKKLNKMKAGKVSVENTLTEEEQAFLDKNNWRVENTDNTIAELKDYIDKKILWGFRSELDYFNQARELNVRMHGIYNKTDKVSLDRHWYGAMFLSMKGWALGTGERIWAPQHVNLNLTGAGARRSGEFEYQKEVPEELQDIPEAILSEGSHLTALKYVLWGMYDAANMLKTQEELENSDDFTIERAKKFFRKTAGSLITRSLYAYAFALSSRFAKDKAIKNMNKIGFSEDQFYSLRRFSAGMLLVTALALVSAAAYAFAKGPDEKDSSDDDIAWGLLYYFALRLEREQEALTMVGAGRTATGGIFKEWNTLANILPAGGSMLLDMYKLGQEATFLNDPTDIDTIMEQGLFADESNSNYYYQKNSFKAKKGDTKFWAHLQRILPYWRSKPVFQYPVSSARSYIYGRSTGTR